MQLLIDNQIPKLLAKKRPKVHSLPIYGREDIYTHVIWRTTYLILGRHGCRAVSCEMYCSNGFDSRSGSWILFNSEFKQSFSQNSLIVASLHEIGQFDVKPVWKNLINFNNKSSFNLTIVDYLEVKWRLKLMRLNRQQNNEFILKMLLTSYAVSLTQETKSIYTVQYYL